jgi:hypothetical protein
MIKKGEKERRGGSKFSFQRKNILKKKQSRWSGWRGEKRISVWVVVLKIL